MPRAKYIGNPAFRIHNQTGTLRKATTGKVISTKPPTYRIEVNENVAPYAGYVIQGTQILLGRDVLWSTLTAKATQNEQMNKVVEVLGKKLRTQAALRFTTDPAGSVKVTILAMNAERVNMKQAAVIAVRTAGQSGLRRIKHNMNLKDHTQAQLDALGNPYAFKHGSIRLHR